MDYGIPSHMTGVLINQKHDCVFGKTEIDVTLSVSESCYRLYVKKYVLDIALHDISHVDKSNLTSGGIVIDVPLMYVPLRNHHLKDFGEETHETNMRNQDDIDYILEDYI